MRRLGKFRPIVLLTFALTVLPVVTAAQKRKLPKREPGPVALEKTYVDAFRAAVADKPSLALELRYQAKATGPIGEELRLLAAEALLKLGAGLAAQLVAVDVATRAIGTNQGEWALAILDRLATQAEIDESLMEDFAYEFDALVESPSEQAMLAWFRARALLRRGYTDWAKFELDRAAGETTQWGAEVAFERAGEVLAEGKADDAGEMYAAIGKRNLVRQSTRQFAELNRARLIFEKGDYKETIQAVRGIDLPLRERARALLEMAWSRYYMREYGRALGLLQVLDSSFYRELRSPEADILKMVIERDLCRYDLVKRSAEDFHQRLKTTYKQIEARKPLQDDPVIKQMALQSRLLQRGATLIYRYRQERKLVDGEDMSMVPGLRAQITGWIAIREKKVEDEINRRLRGEAERVASQFIEWRDQVTFLEYEASIRPLTKAADDEPDYRPTGASRTRFDQLYWPVTRESWWDELEDYEVLVQGRCYQPLLPTFTVPRERMSAPKAPSRPATKKLKSKSKAPPDDEDLDIDDEEDDDDEDAE